MPPMQPSTKFKNLIEYTTLAANTAQEIAQTTGVPFLGSTSALTLSIVKCVENEVKTPSSSSGILIKRARATPPPGSSTRIAMSSDGDKGLIAAYSAQVGSTRSSSVSRGRARKLPLRPHGPKHRRLLRRPHLRDYEFLTSLMKAPILALDTTTGQRVLQIQEDPRNVLVSRSSHSSVSPSSVHLQLPYLLRILSSFPAPALPSPSLSSLSPSASWAHIGAASVPQRVRWRTPLLPHILSNAPSLPFLSPSPPRRSPFSIIYPFLPFSPSGPTTPLTLSGPQNTESAQDDEEPGAHPHLAEDRRYQSEGLRGGVLFEGAFGGERGVRTLSYRRRVCCVIRTLLRRSVLQGPVSLRATWCRRGLCTPRLPAALRVMGAHVVSCDADIAAAPLLAFCVPRAWGRGASPDMHAGWARAALCALAWICVL
ncbi:hypothetical protein C8J57DRAFT_1512627 [Mycena rebaudengoi]|nr:hypothetical protein C8J57DRAFT_1512627 [Mycena rebaudengoi]